MSVVQTLHKTNSKQNLKNGGWETKLLPFGTTRLFSGDMLALGRMIPISGLVGGVHKLGFQAIRKISIHVGLTAESESQSLKRRKQVRFVVTIHRKLRRPISAAKYHGTRKLKLLGSIPLGRQLAEDDKFGSQVLHCFYNDRFEESGKFGIASSAFSSARRAKLIPLKPWGSDAWVWPALSVLCGEERDFGLNKPCSSSEDWTYMIWKKVSLESCQGLWVSGGVSHHELLASKGTIFLLYFEFFSNHPTSKTKKTADQSTLWYLGELRSQGWYIFVLNEELKNLRILEVTG